MHTFLIEILSYKQGTDMDFDSRVMKLSGSNPENAIQGLRDSDVVVDAWTCHGVCN